MNALLAIIAIIFILFLYTRSNKDNSDKSNSKKEFYSEGIQKNRGVDSPGHARGPYRYSSKRS